MDMEDNIVVASSSTCNKEAVKSSPPSSDPPEVSKTAPQHSTPTDWSASFGLPHAPAPQFSSELPGDVRSPEDMSPPRIGNVEVTTAPPPSSHSPGFTDTAPQPSAKHMPVRKDSLEVTEMATRVPVAVSLSFEDPLKNTKAATQPPANEPVLKNVPEVMGTAPQKRPMPCDSPLEATEVATHPPANPSLASADLQETTDTTQPPAKRQRRLQPEDYVRLSAASSDDTKDDLTDMGFSKERVTESMKQKQTLFDPWKRDGCKEWDMQRTRLAKEKHEASRKKRKETEAYEPLYLMSGSEWALFDKSFHEYPLFPGYKAPATFTRFETFKPGNDRIIEINTNSYSVRIKSTPPDLHNKRIDYGKIGPKIVVDTMQQPRISEIAGKAKQPPKRRPGRPRKTVPPAFAPADAPAKKPPTARTCSPVDPSPRRTSGRTMEKVASAEKPRLRAPIIKREPNDDSESDLTDIE